jgi:hypothetical protein
MTSHAGSSSALEQQDMDFQEMVEEEAHRAKEAETKKGKGGVQSGGVVKKTQKPAKAPALDKKWKDVSWKGAAYAFFQPLPAAGKNMLKRAYLYYACRSPNSHQPANAFNVSDLADPAKSDSPEEASSQGCPVIMHGLPFLLNCTRLSMNAFGTLPPWSARTVL